MKKVNLMIVIHPNRKHVLMCHRQTDPYKGLYNFVGGKVNDGEGDWSAAYRELKEETGIKSSQIQLKLLFKTYYPFDDLELQVYYGFLEEEPMLVEEKHPLHWRLLSDDFSNDSIYAGHGNIEHMIQLINLYEDMKRSA